MNRKHVLAACEICPLQKAHYVPTSGPKDAKVALVSRSPGRYDHDAPFTGPSKPVVDFLLGKYGHSRENTILTNVVLCETDSPPVAAVECCAARLEADIANADTIIAAGAEATSILTNVRSVHAGRGYAHERVSSEGRSQRVIVANNPALVLRESDTFPTLVTDFKLALDPLPDPIFPEVEVINDRRVARDILRGWTESNSGFNATDLEWSGLDIYCAGFATVGSKATVFGRNVITDSECFGLLKGIYESDKIHTCWHTGKSDTSILWQNDIHARVDDDTFLLSYALDEEPGRHSLDYLLQTLLGWPYYTPKSVEHFKKTGRLDYYGNEPEQLVRAEYELYEYNGWDAAGTYQLWEILKQKAIDDDVFDAPYRSILQPASDAFRAIELHGFRFDAEKSANIMEAEVLPKLNDFTVKMQKESGMTLLNPRSTKQMSALYYNHWGLKHKLRDKAKQKFSTSTGKEVREEIEGGRFTCLDQYKETVVRFADVHKRFAKVERQRANYFQSLIEHVDSRGYIHPWYNLGGTVTGRTSSTEPNFQNITREGVEGITPVRELFLPSEGCILIQADYSQAELRTMAWLSQDPKLVSIYEDNTRSLHRERAAAFYGESYTKEEYVKSKNINFGVSYGQSAAAFAQMYHMPQEEAQAYIDSWWREFPVLYNWTQKVGQSALTGEVVSPLYYKRRFHLITRDNKEDIQREAINFVPQNTAGGFTILAVTDLVLNYCVPVVNTVHDSIVADVPIEQAEFTAKLMKQVMESIPKRVLGWDLPFTADVSIGKTWAQVEEIDVENYRAIAA